LFCRHKTKGAHNEIGDYKNKGKVINIMQNEGERLTVIAGFDNSGVKPMFFKRLGEKEFKKVKKVNFVFALKEGRKHLMAFEVETAGASYELIYDQESVLWKLKQVFLQEGA